MGFCAIWARPAIFQQRFATNHWLWVRPLTNYFYFLIYKFRFLIYIVTCAHTATNAQTTQIHGRCMPLMKTLLTIVLTVCFSYLFGQNSEDKKYYLPTGVFKSEIYRAERHPKFDGEIKKVGNTYYKFGDKKFKISLEDTTMLTIFQTGIFNPDIIFGKETTHKEQAELDTMSQNQRVFYNLVRNDSLSICCFEQLERLNPNAQTKRFKFWVLRIGVANPTEYYLEFQNDKATKETTLKDFLKSAIMTFYFKGTLII